jgi:exodeoxyribonuclease VII large subunit
VADRLGRALRQNLQVHRRSFIEAAVQLRPGPLSARIRHLAERTVSCARRLNQSQSARLGQAGRHLDSLGRVLDGVSYRSALERGFALVRGDDGTIRRRAAAVKQGESLSITFADGPVDAVATGGTAPTRTRSRAKPSGGQGSLF